MSELNMQNAQKLAKYAQALFGDDFMIVILVAQTIAEDENKVNMEIASIYNTSAELAARLMEGKVAQMRSGSSEDPYIIELQEDN